MRQTKLLAESDDGLARFEDFSELYQARFEGQVRRAFLMTGSASGAADIVSEAFVAVFKRWDSLEQPELYLNRCVVNGCRDWGRRQSRWSKLVDRRNDGAEADARSVLESSASPGSSGAGFDRVDLADALSRLPHRQRVAIVLRFYGRESERSIAEVLGCRPGTVGSLIHRGLVRLRKEWQ